MPAACGADGYCLSLLPWLKGHVLLAASLCPSLQMSLQAAKMLISVPFIWMIGAGSVQLPHSRFSGCFRSFCTKYLKARFPSS